MSSTLMLRLGPFLVVFICVVKAEELTCNYIEPNGDVKSKEEIVAEFNTSHCESNHICNKTFNVTTINIKPYSSLSLVENMLKKCCGNCFPPVFTTFANVSELTQESISTADMVFPVLAREDTEKLYGFHFVPFVPVPSTFFITRLEDKFVGDIINIWPVIIACLLMAIIAGFFCWIFETWKTEEEFPKPFHLGLFEGIWWSFISMTTVGYGKCLYWYILPQERPDLNLEEGCIWMPAAFDHFLNRHVSVGYKVCSIHLF